MLCLVSIRQRLALSSLGRVLGCFPALLTLSSSADKPEQLGTLGDWLPISDCSRSRPHPCESSIFSETKKNPNMPLPPPEPYVGPSQFRCGSFLSRSELGLRLWITPCLEMLFPVLFCFHQQSLGMRLDLPGTLAAPKLWFCCRQLLERRLLPQPHRW